MLPDEWTDDAVRSHIEGMRERHARCSTHFHCGPGCAHPINSWMLKGTVEEALAYFRGNHTKAHEPKEWADEELRDYIVGMREEHKGCTPGLPCGPGCPCAATGQDVYWVMLGTIEAAMEHYRRVQAEAAPEAPVERWDGTWACTHCGWSSVPTRKPDRSVHKDHTLLTCHHIDNTNEGFGYVYDDHWCSAFWPESVPLPRPWEAFCDHGFTGLCMLCLAQALREGRWGG